MKSLIFFLALVSLPITRLAAGQPPDVPATSASGQRICSLPGLAPNVTNSIGEVGLLAAYNLQADRIRSVQAASIVRGQAGAVYGRTVARPWKIPVQVDFKDPSLIRITGMVPWVGSRGFDMASNGREFRLLLRQKDGTKFFVGPVGVLATAQSPNKNLRPELFLDALHWRQARLADASREQSESGVASRTLNVEFVSRKDAPRTARLEFDLRSGTVASLTVYSLDGQLDSEIRYSDWEEVTQPANGKLDGCFPRKITLNQPKHDLRLDMQIVEVTLNAGIPSSHFKLLPPRGIPVVQLSLPDPETTAQAASAASGSAVGSH